MFYTFEQRGRRNLIAEHYVCIEADSLEEANERAIEFEISFEAIDSSFNPKWDRATDPSLLTERPELNGEALEELSYEDYIIVYKDDNLRSSMAILPENEHDPHFIEESMTVPYTSSPYIFFSYMPLTTT